MKILIAGGTGFVGSNLVDELKTNNCVYILSEKESRIYANVRYIKQDLTKPIRQDLPKVDAIIVLAQGNQQFPDGAITEFKVNTLSTLELLEWGRKNKIKRFLYASTGGVYGYGVRRFRETDLPRSKNFYEGTKIAAESLIWQYRKYFNCIIMRFCFPYGPKMAPQRLFSRLISNINHNKEILIKNGGEPKINPIYIADLVTAIIKLTRFKESVILNIGGNNVYSIKSISLKISKIVGKKPNFRYIREQLNNQNLICDISLAKSLIDFQPTVSLEEGLKKTIEEII